jgi:hypothetical protein
MHGGTPGQVSLHAEIAELPGIALEYTVIVRGFWPVGEFHDVGIQPVDAAGIVLGGVLYGLDIG